MHGASEQRAAAIRASMGVNEQEEGLSLLFFGL